VSSTPTVIVCGSLHLDIVVTAPSLPRADETVVGRGWAQVCGGKGGNQAVQAARAGAHVAMISRVGDDAFGRTLRANLEQAGVDHSAVMTDKVAGSGMSVAILREDGDYGAVIVSGANLTINVAEVPRQIAASPSVRVLILQNEIPHAVNVAAARAARQAGVMVILNAAPMRDMGDDLLSHVNVLVLNRVEAAEFLHAPMGDRPAAERALAKHDCGNMVIIVTLGGDGLVGATARGLFALEAVPVTVTSTHGAGDCFVGSLAAELAKGADIEQACRIANHRAAEFVSR
jgi:ribokinase